jgi:hypothetical protein
MRPCRKRLGGHPRGDALKELSELPPLLVEQDTPKMEDELGAVQAPAHAGPVQTKGHRVADRSFRTTCANVQVLSAELGIRHAVAMLRQIRPHLVEALTAAAVARTCLGDLVQGPL